MLAIETHLASLMGKISVFGKEHLAEIPRGGRVVIATTHLSDADIPLVIKALGNDFDLAISDISTHHTFAEDRAGKISIGIAGEKNFLPFDYEKVPGKEAAQAKGFNPDNFVAMKKALENGKEVIVAAHNPSRNGKLLGGGIGAVYLSQLADAVILPVAVNVKSKEPYLAGKTDLQIMKERPAVDVTIGKPMKLEPIEGVGELKEIFDKRQRHEIPTKEDVQKFKSLRDALGEQSDAIMRKLAAMIPEEKRGPYGEIPEKELPPESLTQAA